MKRIYKALFSLALSLALTLALGNGSLCLAAEPETPEGAYAGYLVQLRSPSQGEASLFSAQEIPETLISLDEEQAIYSAPDLDSIRDLVYAGQVEFAEPDYQVELFDVVSNPNDPNFTSGAYQYNLREIGVQAAWYAGLSG